MSDLIRNTLIVKHFPSELNIREREELLKLFGAKKVKCMLDNSKMKYTAFALFETHEEAKHVLSKLHQTKILNKHLTVEFARNHYETEVPKESDFPAFEPNLSKETKEIKVPEKEILRLENEKFSKKVHGISPSLNLDYMPSPLLRYKYPEPTSSIIANISHALIAVPKFYTQVLHLMNKMNLPAPFGPVTPAPPLHQDLYPFSVNQIETAYVENMDTSADESELESDADENAKRDTLSTLKKRPAKKAQRLHKKPKLQQLLPVNPSLNTVSIVKQDPSEVFDSQRNVEMQKKISFNINPSIDPEKTIPEKQLQDTGVLKTEGFGKIEAPKPAENKTPGNNDSDSDSWTDVEVISRRELRDKRISSREMKTLSVFKNYSPGEPTVRLYIKNLARQVEEKDLRFIFGRFVDKTNEIEKNMFDVRLMKEGRMKGQAFVTLANETQAIKAVTETNGFLLHTKPLVVQFARSAKPKETPAKK